MAGTTEFNSFKNLCDAADQACSVAGDVILGPITGRMLGPDVTELANSLLWEHPLTFMDEKHACP